MQPFNVRKIIKGRYPGKLTIRSILYTFQSYAIFYEYHQGTIKEAKWKVYFLNSSDLTPCGFHVFGLSIS